jgi:hypothetical protein
LKNYNTFKIILIRHLTDLNWTILKVKYKFCYDETGKTKVVKPGVAGELAESVFFVLGAAVKKVECKKSGLSCLALKTCLR